MIVTLRLIFLTLRFIIILACKNEVSLYFSDPHIFIENVKPIKKVFYFL